MPLQLRSLVRPDATLELSLAEVPMPEPTSPDEVVVRVEAAPLNPSDLALLFGGADMTQAKSEQVNGLPVVTAPIPQAAMAWMKARIGESLPNGNEGAGTVVAAGSSPEAQALVGKRVGLVAGAMFSEYRAVSYKQCIVLPDDVSSIEGASCFVNPMTSLAMVETMRDEGHTGLVHTAAASNLGQMLNRICLNDGVPLVNIVRRDDQADLLRKLGAAHVVNSSAETFRADLTEALVATGATLAFDAIGGGKLAGQILMGMEAALLRRPNQEYSRYGTSVHKQVYVYGGLDRSNIELPRGFGMAWGVGGWLLFPFMQKVGPQRVKQLKERVLSELKTTFASHYSKQVSMVDALSLDAIASYGKMGTGEKALILPSQA